MSKKIKLLHILPSFTRAGAETVVFNLLNSLDQNQYELAVVLFKDKAEGLDWEEALRAKQILVHRLSKNSLIDVRNLYQLFKIVKTFQADIVHTHLGGDIFGRFVSRLVGVKVIVSTEHNVNIQERLVARLFKKYTKTWIKKVFAVSQAVLQDASSRYNLSSSQITVVYNGIDVSYFKHQQRPLVAHNDLIIGSLSRLSSQKGLSTLIDAVSEIKATNFVVKIAGEGELKVNLEQQIKRLNLENQISLPGLVSSRDFLAGIDIFVFPSLWEGLGLSLLEAAAMSKVVLVSDIDGIKEVVDCDNGFLFKAGDHHDLAKQLNYIITNFASEEVQAKTLRLNDKIKTQFSVEKMVSTYDNWYQKLLSDL